MSLVIFTRVVSEEQIDNYCVLATSFLRHHPEREMYCLTDLELPEIEGVTYIDRFANIEDYGDMFLFVAPTVCFLNCIERVLKKVLPGLYHPSLRDEVMRDVYFYSKHDRGIYKEKEDPFLNTSLPPFIDCGSIIGYREMMNVTPVLNTREFSPSVPQRNSYKTLIFPWERYFQAVKYAEKYLSEEYVSGVIANAVKHPYMLHYVVSGVLDETGR